MSTFAKVVRMVVLTLQVAVSVNEEKTSLGFGIDIKKSDNDHITGYERKKTHDKNVIRWSDSSNDIIYKNWVYWHSLERL